jgi:hypothetical protein
LNFIGQRQNDGNKNIKIMKLDDDKYYIISNMFKLASKFNSKSSLDIDEVNELISIDIMFILNIKEFEKKWKVNVTIL